jgi:hypothetical protein
LGWLLSKEVPGVKEHYHGKVPRRPGFDRTGGLEQLVSTGKSAGRKLTHARILLLVDAVRGKRAPASKSLRHWGPARRRLLASENDSSSKGSRRDRSQASTDASAQNQDQIPWLSQRRNSVNSIRQSKIDDPLRGFTSYSRKLYGFDILYFFCPGHNELATEAIADVTDKIERPFILIGRS